VLLTVLINFYETKGRVSSLPHRVSGEGLCAIVDAPSLGQSGLSKRKVCVVDIVVGFVGCLVGDRDGENSRIIVSMICFINRFWKRVCAYLTELAPGVGWMGAENLAVKSAIVPMVEGMALDAWGMLRKGA